MEEQKERKDKYDMSDVTDIQLEGSYGEYERKCIACLDQIQKTQIAAGSDIMLSSAATEVLTSISQKFQKEGIDMGLIIDENRDGREQFVQATRYSWQSNNPNAFYLYLQNEVKDAQIKFNQFNEKQSNALNAFGLKQDNEKSNTLSQSQKQQGLHPTIQMV